MIPDEELGLLIMEQQKHLHQLTGPGMHYFGATLFAGQCGRFLGKLRRMEVISDIELVRLFAADVGILTKPSSCRTREKGDN